MHPKAQLYSFEYLDLNNLPEEFLEARIRSFIKKLGLNKDWTPDFEIKVKLEATDETSDDFKQYKVTIFGNLYN